MSDEVLVTCENISKKYCRSLKRSLWYGVQDISSELNPFRGKKDIVGTNHFPKLRKDEFWAVQDISFELKRGECLGLIGHNGAGKSTLLKMLNGLIKPDHGKISMKGRIGAIIELNAGFNPILTGRENVYIYGSILGFTKKEIDQKYNDIVDFAELADFMEMPFRSYSSGMKVRLGFAVASQMEPDVLIIDEVLAVGDVGFRSKCYNRIGSLLKKSTVIIVSHSIPHIDRYCDNVLFLNKGIVESDSSRDEKTGKFGTIEKYYGHNKNNYSQVVEKMGNHLIDLVIKYSDLENKKIQHGQSFNLHIRALLERNVKNPLIQLSFVNRELQIIAVSRSQNYEVLSSNGHIDISITICPFLLNSGEYYLSLLIFNEDETLTLIWYDTYWKFTVCGAANNYGTAPIYFNAIWENCNRK